MPKFTIGGESFDFLDPENAATKLTWPELKLICSLGKVKLDEIDPGIPDVFQAIVLVSVKRKRPEFTFGDLDDVMMEVLDSMASSARSETDADAEGADAADPPEPEAPTPSG